jgi:predicted AlkP superfamily pyrophosphatase or phosphodiesterase
MMGSMVDVASVTSTVCDLFGIPRPADCVAAPFSEVAAFAARRTVTKALVFAADAIGAHLIRSYPEAFEPIARYAPTCVDACAVMPSVTPVCFASMFTGAPPDIHGIRRSERPTLTCDTLFDALSRVGRRVAIVAVKNSSIDLIFRNRRIDYFSETYDEEVVERSLDLIAADQHDFILAYQQEYDDKMHATVPRSPEALRAMANHVRNFDRVARAARSRWITASHAVAFVSDHGTHIDPTTGRGTHGSDMADDLEVRLFWGLHFLSEPGHSD